MYVLIYMCVIVSLVFIFFAHSLIEYKYFSNRFIWSIVGTRTGTTNPDQSGPVSKGNEGVLYTLKISKTGALPSETVWYQTQDIYIFLVGDKVLFFCRKYSQHYFDEASRSHRFWIQIFPSTGLEGCPRDVTVKVTDCGIVVSEFVLQSRYYVHFRANTLGKGMNPLTLPAMG